MMLMLFRNHSTPSQMNSSLQYGSSFTLAIRLGLAGCVTVGLWLSSINAADETKSGTPPNQEAAPAPAGVTDKMAIERRPTGPTVLKEASTPTKILRYSSYLLNQYDADRDGVLQKNEWKAMHGKPELMDVNGDGDITVEEITRWVANYGRRKQTGHVTPTDSAAPESSTSSGKVTAPAEPEAPPQSTSVPPGERSADRTKETKYYVSPKRLPAGLPEWFVQKDTDGDGQLTFSEYSPGGVTAELMEFESYDANGDGMVTAKECMQKNSDKPTKDGNDSRGNANGQSNNKNARGKKKTKDTP